MRSPLIDISSDGHVHTRLCNHAAGEMHEYVEKAIGKGLGTITFLEHLETAICYQPRTWLEEEDFDYYFQEGTRLRERYRDCIDIRLGVETGYNPLAVEAIQENLRQHPWDHIGLSCHFFHHQGTDFNLLSHRQEKLAPLAAIGIDNVITSYFDALIEAVDSIECDVLCHLDAVLRHYPGIAFNAFHDDQVEILLNRLQHNDIALEINTSGIDYRGTPFPASWIIAKAMTRGIRLCAGSDAHHPDQVGRHFTQLPAYLLGIAEENI